MIFNPVKISDVALEEIKKILLTKGLGDQFGLRIGIKGAGCVGTTYMLGFDQKTEHDEIFIEDNIKILIEKKHLMYLIGVGIDFIDNNSQRGFTFVDK